MTITITEAVAAKMKTLNADVIGMVADALYAPKLIVAKDAVIVAYNKLETLNRDLSRMKPKTHKNDAGEVISEFWETGDYDRREKMRSQIKKLTEAIDTFLTGKPDAYDNNLKALKKVSEGGEQKVQNDD